MEIWRTLRSLQYLTRDVTTSRPHPSTQRKIVKKLGDSPAVYRLYYLSLCPEFSWATTPLEAHQLYGRWQKIYYREEDFWQLVYLTLKALVLVRSTPEQQRELQRRILATASATQGRNALPFFRRETSCGVTWALLQQVDARRKTQ